MYLKSTVPTFTLRPVETHNWAVYMSYNTNRNDILRTFAVEPRFLEITLGLTVSHTHREFPLIVATK